MLNLHFTVQTVLLTAIYFPSAPLR